MSGSGQDAMVSSEVEVAVDPDTAFAAFTEELDLWWVRGPINHFAGGRALGPGEGVQPDGWGVRAGRTGRARRAGYRCTRGPRRSCRHGQ